MLVDIGLVRYLVTRLRAELADSHGSQVGYSTEAVVITAALVALAIVVVGIIAMKVISKANSIQTQ